jgi:hypothetical protein
MRGYRPFDEIKKRTAITTAAATVKPIVAIIEMSIVFSRYFFTDSSYAFDWDQPLIDGV